jgi:AcrR family transcriptional regulator
MTDSNPTAAEKRPSRKSTRRQDASPAPGGDMRDLVSQLKRERILSAAVDLFYRQGYAHTTLDEVAKALGVTKPFIYQYYRSKNALLAEICSRAIMQAHATLNRTLTQQGTAKQKLWTIVSDFTRTVLENQAHAVIYNREEKELEPEDRDRINRLRRDFDHRLVQLLDEGMANKEFVIQDVRLAALAVGSIVGWAPVWFRSGGRLSKQEAADGAASLVLTMVGCPPSESRPNV